MVLEEVASPELVLKETNSSGNLSPEDVAFFGIRLHPPPCLQCAGFRQHHLSTEKLDSRGKYTLGEGSQLSRQ